MSYKDGIPLLSTFDDDPEDDGYGISSEVERRKCKCAKGHLCFGVVLVFAMVLVLALAVSITLGFTLKNKGGGHPAASGHDTGHVTVASVVLSSLSPGVSSNAASTSGAPILLSYSSGIQPEPTYSFQLESSTIPAQVSGSGGPSLVPTVSAGPPVSVPPSGTPVASSSGMVQPSLTTFAEPSSSSTALPVSSALPSYSAAPLTSSAAPPPLSSATPSLSSVTPTLSSATPSLSSATPSLSSASPSLSSATPSLSSAAPSLSSSTTTLPSSSAIPEAPLTTASKPSVHSSISSSSVSSAEATPTPTPTPTPIPPPTCIEDNIACPSPQDHRTYHFADLTSNNLRVLFISDPLTDLSGASMNVAAGSFNDPANYTGLAHFCEHMLFLGTEKYPDKNEYSNYLSTHGGYDNAYTDSQETNYFFRIQAGYLDHALDLFAQFFISPLFNSVYVQKELNAVNQEHKKNLLSDDWKLWQLLKHVSNPYHPFHQFATGDFETLNKSDVRDQLLRYYRDSYSASTMNLVVYGRENISTLMDLVTRSFSNINNTNVLPRTYSDKQPFHDYIGRIIVYEPQASTNTLTLFWQTPSLQEIPRNAVSDFIVRYLGHEGEGSIFRYLQLRNLASTLVADVEVAADSFYLFKLQITLTEGGLANVSQVIKTVFEFMNVFKNMTSDEFESKWEDYIRVSLVTFDYKDKESPSDYVKDISRTMRVNPLPADFLPNPRLYRPSFYSVQNTLRRFTVGNCLIFIGTKGVNISSDPSPREDFSFVLPGVLSMDNATAVPLPILDLVEPIYSTPFTIYTTPAQLLTYWSPAQENPELYLATPNVFVPDGTHLIPVPPSNQTSPVQIGNSLTMETWVLPDTRTFYEPKVNLRCELKAGKVMKTPHWAAMAQVYLDMVTNKLGSTVYSAEEVGYTLSLFPNPRGVVFELGGLSDEDIIRSLINITIKTLVNDGDVLRDSVVFDLAMADIRDTLQNFNYTTLPFRYTYQYLQSVLLERPTWTHELILQELDNLTLSSVLQYGNSNLLSDLNIVCLVHGSTTTDTAVSYVSLLNHLLTTRISSSPVSGKGFPTRRVELPAGKEYGLALPTFNPADSNSVVNVLFQAGEVCLPDGASCTQDTLLTGVYLSLLNLVIADECFTQLRTIEGLGYVVFCFSRVHENIGSFQVIVQSEEFSPGHVLNSTNSFLKNFLNATVMSAEFEDHFTDIVDVLRLSLSQRDLALSDKTDRLWQEVLSGELQFDLRQQQIGALDGLLVENFQDFYSELIIEEENRKKLILVVYGKDKEIKLDVDCDILYDQIEQTGADLKTSCS